MGSVADFLRADADRDVAEMSASDRVALALDLGEQAAATYASANGVSLEAARLTLRRSGQAGRRRRSVAASLDA